MILIILNIFSSPVLAVGTALSIACGISTLYGFMLYFKNGGKFKYKHGYYKEIIKSIGERFRELPHIIIPQNKLLFEECEKKLDRFTFLHGGKIRSVVSYENFDAHIYVELPFFEFHGEDLELLRFITNSMDMVHFYTTEGGGIRLSVSLEYFYDAGDKDAIIAEEVSKHPKLLDIMNKLKE